MDSWLDKLNALRDTMSDAPQEDTPQEPVKSTTSHSGRLDIIFERKGRGGKTATIITGFTITDEEIDALAAEIKKRLGTGGSARGGEILIQGDRRNDILKFLNSKGFKARII